MTPIQNLADNLAALGRYEDTYMVHAAEGETVVPRDVLDANPILKTALFAQMRSMGIENPDRYVVGSGLNSVNPITGQPEFFFKKIKRLVKKIAAPVGGTIGFALAGPAGAAIGSGLGSLVGGASPKQALGTAAIGGFLGYGAGKFDPNLQGQLQGAFRGIPGIGGLMPGGSSDMDRYIQLQRQLANRLKPQFGPGVTPEAQGLVALEAAQAQGAQAGALAKMGAWAKKNPLLAAGLAGAGGLAISSLMSGSGAEKEEFTDPLRYQDYLRERNALGDNATPDQVRQLRISYGLSPTPPTPMEGLQPGYGMADGGSVSQEENPGNVSLRAAYANALNKELGPLRLNPSENAEMIGLYRNGLRLLEQGTIPEIVGFEQYWQTAPAPEEPAPQEEVRPPDQAMMPQNQYVDPRTSDRDRYIQFQRQLANQLNLPVDSPEQQQVIDQLSEGNPPTVSAARGGGLSQLRDQMVAMQGFPRRNGAISGPGGPRDDLIPAMLSDGEFVMNERAVRGAGGGNLALGTRRMYDLMNRFEGAAS